jgi:hypothetical protein
MRSTAPVQVEIRSAGPRNFRGARTFAWHVQELEGWLS